jgi:hypothetical protein
MMHDLAMALKTAGFPQGGKGAWALPPDALYARYRDRVYAPTLSELIAACGSENFRLGHDSGGWYAAKTDGGERKHYASPEEAVARLWLELQEQEAAARR